MRCAPTPGGRYETFEFNHAAVLGLGVAVEEALGWGLGAIEDRVTGLGAALRTKLADAGFATYDIGRRLCAIVTTQVPGRGATEVRELLFERSINVSVSRARSTRIDAERRGLPELIRISPHYYNTEDELDEMVAALARLRP
jgi:selenocysteine lyase/cysteine desulfurase